MRTVNILLVDDSPDFLDSALGFLLAHSRHNIVGLAQSGREALDQVTALQPDLVLMDISMPGMNGIEATKQLKTRPDAPRVVILTLYDTQEYRSAARRAQADGFIAKSEFGNQLLPLIDVLFA